MYYDLVKSTYQTNGKESGFRIDSQLICGGFETVNDAVKQRKLANSKEFDCYVSEDQYTCIEIEGHKNDGSLYIILTIDE